MATSRNDQTLRLSIFYTRSGFHTIFIEP